MKPNDDDIRAVDADEAGFDSELGPLWDELRRTRGDCPPDDVLLELARRGAPDGTVAHHVALCPACREIVELAAADPAGVDDMSWRRVERSLDRRPTPWRSQPRPQSRWQPLAFAAAMLLAVSLGTIVWLRMDPAAETSNGAVSTERGAAVVPLQPAGEVAAVEQFTWSAPPAELRFIIVIEQNGREVWRGETVGSPYRVPPDLQAQFEQAGSFRWRVIAIDRGGTELVTSEWRAFEIR